MIGIVQWCSPK